MDSLHEIEAQEAFRRECDGDGSGVDYPDGEAIVPWPWIIPPQYAKEPAREAPTLVITAASFADRECVVCGALGEGLTCQDEACLEYLRGRLGGRPVRKAAS